MLSMLLKNTCHMWYSSIFQEEIKDVYREESILMLLWQKLEQLCCSVVLGWVSSSISQGIIPPNLYCISSFRCLGVFDVEFLLVCGLFVQPSAPISTEFLILDFVTSP